MNRKLLLMDVTRDDFIFWNIFLRVFYDGYLISTFFTPVAAVSAGTMAIAPFVAATMATTDAASSAFFGSWPRPENARRCQNVLNWLASMPLACCSAAS